VTLTAAKIASALVVPRVDTVVPFVGSGDSRAAVSAADVAYSKDGNDVLTVSEQLSHKNLW
jgi:hypothetical protein